MGVADLPLLQQIKGRLGWLDERQRVIAQNVANADSPGFKPSELKQPAIASSSESKVLITATGPKISSRVTGAYAST